MLSGHALGQTTPGSATIKTATTAAQPWEYTLTVDGYVLSKGTSYVNPVLTADHKWLHTSSGSREVASIQALEKEPCRVCGSNQCKRTCTLRCAF